MRCMCAQELKRDRAVVLTTHSMLEAETLGDRIAIMAAGRLCAIGTPLRLKNVYGAGYRLNLTAPVPRLPGLLDIVRQHVPDAAVAARDAGNVAVTVPFFATDRIPDLIARLEALGGDALGEWGISHPTLEEVFLRITAGSGFAPSRAIAVSAGRDMNTRTQGTVAAAGAAHCADAGVARLPPPAATAAATGAATPNAAAPAAAAPTDAAPAASAPAAAVAGGLGAEHGNAAAIAPRDSHAVRALLRKSLTLQMRQRGTLLCQVVSPLLVIGLMVLLQFIVRAQLGGTQEVLVPGLPVPLNFNMLLPEQESKTGECLQFFLARDGTPDGSLGNLTATGALAGCIRLGGHCATLIAAPCQVPGQACLAYCLRSGAHSPVAKQRRSPTSCRVAPKAAWSRRCFVPWTYVLGHASRVLRRAALTACDPHACPPRALAELEARAERGFASATALPQLHDVSRHSRAGWLAGCDAGGRSQRRTDVHHGRQRQSLQPLPSRQ